MISQRGAHAIPLPVFPQSGSMPQFCAIIVPDAHGTAFRRTTIKTVTARALPAAAGKAHEE